jgi:hypothetical protein
MKVIQFLPVSRYRGSIFPVLPLHVTVRKILAHVESGAVFLGLTWVESEGNHFLLAANFSQNRIEMFDKNFKRVDLSEEAFADDHVRFGGTIAAFDVASGKFLGNLLDAANSPIAINGLWGLEFDNRSSNQAGTTQTPIGPIGRCGSGLRMEGRIHFSARANCRSRRLRR